MSADPIAMAIAREQRYMRINAAKAAWFDRAVVELGCAWCALHPEQHRDLRERINVLLLEADQIGKQP